MQDRLLLLHEFLNEVAQAENEDELARLSEKYRDALQTDSEEDVIYKLWQDVKTLGSEMLFLRSSGTDASRGRKIAALSDEERAELSEVEAIIDENRFCYHFQPIVNTHDGSVYSYEALMRPESDMKLTPFHILKYAELMGKLSDIERGTFLNVLSIINDDKEKFRDRKVFINSIPKTTLSGSDLRRVGELLMEHSDTAVVEFTEQTEPDESELNTLKERYMNMGVEIAIDDYGTGYSNVRNLLRYMPDYVKIDRSLLSDIQDNPKKRHFVREIIEFCHGNGILALAEGVETSEELRTVILMGVDLIQGFYTARPGAEVIDAIPYEIRQEIKTYQQERQDGKGRQIYASDSGERIQLDKLVRDDYKCILAGKTSDENNVIAVIGSPTLDTDIHIETVKDFKGKIILENAHLSNVKGRPCIDLGENSDVTIKLNGENKLTKGGIRVPEGATLRFEGDGNLDINIYATEYFGIGNDIFSRHGDIIFDHSGTVIVTTDGQTGICIGSGLGGNIKICQGKYSLNMSGETGVGIGAVSADGKVDIYNCDFNADMSLKKGIAVGSASGNANVHISRSSAKIYMGGETIAAIGTLSGDKAEILINDAIVSLNVRASSCICVGAHNGSTVVSVENAAFRAAVGDGKALPFGGLNADTKVRLTGADATINVETDIELEKYISPDILTITGGRTVFTVNGDMIELG